MGAGFPLTDPQQHRAGQRPAPENCLSAPPGRASAISSRSPVPSPHLGSHQGPWQPRSSRRLTLALTSVLPVTPVRLCCAFPHPPPLHGSGLAAWSGDAPGGGGGRRPPEVPGHHPRSPQGLPALRSVGHLGTRHPRLGPEVTVRVAGGWGPTTGGGWARLGHQGKAGLCHLDSPFWASSVVWGVPGRTAAHETAGQTCLILLATM